MLVALAAHLGAKHGPQGVTGASFLELVRGGAAELDPRLDDLLTKIDDHLRRGAAPAELAEALGLRRGVTGYIYHTVPLVLYCWLRWPGDFRRAVEEVIMLGGDADTTGAILGGIAGATVGVAGIPEQWVNGVLEWPRSVAWMRNLAGRLAGRFSLSGAVAASKPLPLFWPGLVLRNLLFLLIVLVHVFRRVLPPY